MSASAHFDGPTERVLLRAYLRGADRPPHIPTSEQIVKAARQSGLAGATVLRGILGFGSRGWNRPRIWSIVDHSPLIVELVDDGEKIASFIRERLDQIMKGGMVTLERAHVMLYRHGKNPPGDSLRIGAALEPLSTLPQFESRHPMRTNEDGILLRIFIGESDRFGHQPLHEAILERARALGLAGATVLRGSEGFGANSVVHKATLLEMSSDLPIVIEMVDAQEQIEKLLPELEQMVQEGMVTMEYVRVLIYRHDAEAAG
jgi:PII-like signaling protein